MNGPLEKLPGLETKPEFATNCDGRRVADAISTHIEWVCDKWKEPPELAIASPYFNADGFDLIADALERAGNVRLLLGVDPDEADRRRRHLSASDTPAASQSARIRNALAGHTQTMAEDRNLLGFEYEADARAMRLVEWLRSGRVEVRRYQKGFLHGKAFIVSTDAEGVIAGSSNFTYAGLARNRELNLGHYQPNVVRQVVDWFEELWHEAEPFDLAALYAARYEPHNPHLIYLRMLWERYGSEIEEEAKAEGTSIHLTTFQQDGLWRARRILAERNGVVIADGVGLGKTFLAGELIRDAVQRRRQRALVVAPAALRDGTWRKFLLDHSLGVEHVSYEELSRDRRLSNEGDRDVLHYGIDEYQLVVVDEAHAYRNPDTQRAAVLRKLLSGTPPKQLALLTATPVNNSLWDLYYLLAYFVKNDAAFADAGIRSLRDHFGQAMALEPDDLSPERLFDVLDTVAVRRTRHFVKRYYPHDSVQLDGAQMRITFPKPVVRTVSYDLDATLPGFFEEFERLLEAGDHAVEARGGGPQETEIAGNADSAPVLTLARYAPSAYRTDGAAEAYEAQLAGLIRSGLLKRFESSAYAFALTCRRMAENHAEFLALLDKGYVATGSALTEWMATDSDELDAVQERLGEDVYSAGAYDVEALRADVLSDREILLDLAGNAESLTPDRDPKLAQLADSLAEIAAEAEADTYSEGQARDRRKVIVFTYYADTVEWIREYLEKAVSEREDLAAYRGRIASLTGSGGDSTKILQEFVPMSSQAPSDAEDRFDLLIATDVVAEGVNLQQARNIINYDLPWNPMRLVQRHGRIDRIGSPHDEVMIRCVLPDRQLDGLLGLEERLDWKLKQAARSIGVENEVLPGTASEDVTFAETREEIERLRSEDPSLFEQAGETGHAHSGEEYRQELRAGLQDPAVAELVKSLPWGAGSGLARGKERGFVFCAQVADHDNPQFRWVAAAESDGGEPDVAADTLASLARAHADADTPRVLDDETRREAYEAWAIARRDIYEYWQQATDPRELQPAVPKPMRDAAALVQAHPPAGLSGDEIKHLLDTIEAPYGVRIQRLFRDILKKDEADSVRSAEIAQLVEELGLEPAPAPEALPVISQDDVHLVCWMAVVPE